MPVFEYKALDSRGRTVKGIKEAESEAKARAKLRAEGRFPVAIKQSREKAQKSGQSRQLSLFSRIRGEEVTVMTRQLATLLGAGIPLVEALGSLVEQCQNSALKRVIAEIKTAVNEGKPLTAALGEHPKLFSSVFVNMVRAGEASGSLDIVLDRLADFAEKQQALKGRLRAALVYPVFMAVIGTGILVFLITYIVPNITQVFDKMDRVLPMPTQVLIGLSDFLRNYWWSLAGIWLLLAMAIRFFLKTKTGRRSWDYLKLRMIVTGTVTQKVMLARFASTLASLLDSGVGLLSAMQIVRTLMDNVHIEEVVDTAMERVNKGRSMSNALSESEWFPPMFVQMIGVGEQSGTLEKMLQKAATAYEREVETAILGMTALIEPMMIAGMGMAVGFVVLSILLPIFEMNQLVG